MRGRSSEASGVSWGGEKISTIRINRWTKKESKVRAVAPTLLSQKRSSLFSVSTAA